MWVARNKDGDLMLWDCDEKPRRLLEKTWACDNHRGVGYINPKLFPNLTWESEPIQADLLSEDILSDLVMTTLKKTGISEEKQCEIFAEIFLHRYYLDL